MGDEDTKLAEALLHALLELVDNHGFIAPIHIACISSNGCVGAAVYRANKSGPAEVETLMQYVPPTEDGMTPPISFLYVDSQGRRAASRLAEDETLEILH